MKRTSQSKTGSKIETETETTAPGAGRGSRVGKIARLPWHVRQELNRRLLDGEPARRLVAWLNRLPEVRAVLRRDFDGRSISEQNLSEWKQGGFRDYVAKVEADAVLAETLEVTAAVKPKPSSRGRKSGKKEAEREEKPESVTDRVADWFFPYYVAAARGRLAAAQTEDERWNVLRTILADLGNLRRNEHQVERLRLWREKLEVEVAVKESAKEGVKEEEFLKWARQQPDLEQKIWPDRQFLTAEERAAAVDQILGISPVHRAEPEPEEIEERSCVKGDLKEVIAPKPMRRGESDPEAEGARKERPVAQNTGSKDAVKDQVEPVAQAVPVPPPEAELTPTPAHEPVTDADDEPEWVRPKRTSQIWRTLKNQAKSK